MNNEISEGAISTIKSEYPTSMKMEYWDGAAGGMMVSCGYAPASKEEDPVYKFNYRTYDKAKLLAIMAAAGIDVGDVDAQAPKEASEQKPTLNDTPVGHLFSAAANEQITKEKSLDERSSAFDRIANPRSGFLGASVDVEGGYITDASLYNVPSGEVPRHRVECTMYSWEDLLGLLKFLGVELPKTDLTLAEEAAKFLHEPNGHISLNVGL